MKKYILIFFSFFLSFIGFGQVSFSTIPQNKQLVGRDLSTNQGSIMINGEVNNGPYYNLDYDSWSSGEPNDAPAPENVAEMYGNTTILEGLWNDGSVDNTNPSYVEYEGEINSLGGLIYLGQYNGHSYFKNP